MKKRDKFISKSVVERNVANLKHTLEKFDFAPIPRKVQVATTSYAYSR